MHGNETDEEGKLIHNTAEGKVYVRSSTFEDAEKAEALKQRLAESLKKFVSKADSKEKESLAFRYQIGEYLKTTMAEANIPMIYRKDLWREIDDIADPERLITKPAGISSSNQGNSRHPFFETCYLMATYFDKDNFAKFSWHQYNDLFGRPVVFEYPALFHWFSMNIDGMSGLELREVLKIATAYSKTHDFDCFEENELFEKMDLFLAIERQWTRGLNTYFKGKKKNLSEARQKQKTKYKGKYIDACLLETRFLQKAQWADACDRVFREIYVDVFQPLGQ